MRSPSASTRRCRTSRRPTALSCGGTIRAPPGSPMPAASPRRRRGAPRSSSSTRAARASRSRRTRGCACGPAATARWRSVSPTCCWKRGTTTRPSCATGATARCWCARTTARRCAPTTSAGAPIRRSGWRGTRAPARRCSTTRPPAATTAGRRRSAGATRSRSRARTVARSPAARPSTSMPSAAARIRPRGSRRSPGCRPIGCARRRG